MGKGIHAGGLGRERGHSSAWGIHKSAYTFTIECQSSPVEEEDRNMAVTPLLKVLCVDAVEDSTLSLAA